MDLCGRTSGGWREDGQHHRRGEPRAAPHKCSCDACCVPCWAQRLNRHRKRLHSPGTYGQGWAGEGGTRVTRQLGRGSDGTEGNPSTDQVVRYLGRRTFFWKTERPPVRTAVNQFIPTPTSVTCFNQIGESCRRRNKSPIMFSKKHTPPSLTKRKTVFPSSGGKRAGFHGNIPCESASVWHSRVCMCFCPFLRSAQFLGTPAQRALVGVAPKMATPLGMPSASLLPPGSLHLSSSLSLPFCLLSMGR